MSKKRFLYVGGFQLPDKNAAAHRVVTIAKILNTLGYEVIFLDIDESKTEYSLSPAHMEAGFVTYSQKKPTGTKKWAEYVLHPLHVEEVLDKYTDWEGAIAYNYPAMALQKLRKICKRRNMKIYADCTEWYKADYLRTIRDIALTVDTFFKMRMVHKNLDGMIAISSHLDNYYKKHLPTVVIPPLVDKCDSKWEREEGGTSEEVIHLSYAGQPGRKKDKLDGMIRAIYKSRNENICLHVVGISREEFLEYYPECAEAVNDAKVKDRIRFHGIVPHREALEIVKNSDYTVFYREITIVTTAGFPTKFVESISCNVPVITNATSDLKQYLLNDKNGVLLSTEHFEEELLSFLDGLSTQRPKKEVEEDIFDYRRYVEPVENWLKGCN